MARSRRWAMPFLAAPVVALALLSLAACSDEERSPAEARRDRVEQRLRATFSGAQARCILDDVDDTVLRALDRKADLDADTAAMERYSAAVARCVADPDSTPTTAPATTTAPASTTTTGG